MSYVNQLISDVRSSQKKALVVGLGISGLEAALFLSRAGLPVICTERQGEDEYLAKSKFADRLDELRASGIELNFGIDGEKASELFTDVGIAVLSPGVSLESAIAGALRRREIPLIGELELGIETLAWPSIVVSGSNGKSTTVSLIAHILEQAGKKHRLCGNIGVPVVAQIDSLNSDEESGILVVEASSYQLESCSVLKPKVAVLLNISDNHLERHGTLERYFKTKARMLKNQDSGDFAVLCSDDKFVKTLIARQEASVERFGISLSEDGAGVEICYEPLRGIDRLVRHVNGNEEVFELKGAKLIGLHNRYNAAAAVAACRSIGIEIEPIQKALLSFTSLEHRLERVGAEAKRVFINDAKSTTVASTQAAFQSVVSSFPETEVSLLIGGRAKAGSWDPLFDDIEEARSRINPIVCFGEDGRILAHHCKSKNLPHKLVSGLKEAVTEAVNTSRTGNVVLLSPGCASFDEFRDFEERGNMFKSYVGSI